MSHVLLTQTYKKACTWKGDHGNIESYYSYMLVYVDNIQCIHEDPDSVLKVLNNYFPLKPDSVGAPDVYLGAKVKPMQLENGVWVWGISIWGPNTSGEQVVMCKSI